MSELENTIFQLGATLSAEVCARLGRFTFTSARLGQATCPLQDQAVADERPP